jgi:hypothetical protein
MKKIIYSAAIILASTFFTSCSDFLDVSPSYELPDGEVITNVKEAQAALDGVYSRFISRYYYGCDMVTYGDVRGDDLGTTLNGNRTNNQYRYGHTTSINSTNAGYFWEHIYASINRANRLLEKIENGSVVATSDEDKAEVANIKAQALVLRAFMHFDLVRIFGEPYLKNKNAYGVVKADRVFAKEEKPQRSTVDEIYKFIISDLTTAIGATESDWVLSDVKTDGAINVWAAKSFLSKVYLYMGENEKSYDLAKEVIESGVYSLIDGRDYVRSWGDAFTTEAIFEIYTSDVENADRESLGSVINPSGYLAVTVADTTSNLFVLLKEDLNDCRLGMLQKGTVNNGRNVVYFINKKYPGREGNMYVNNPHLIRLSEVYLIAAEAGALAGKSDAADYLDDIRMRANPAVAPTPSSVTGQDLVDLVMKERRKELFGEGHRFFDITRNLGTREVVRTGTSTNPISNDMFVPKISWNNNNTYLLIMPIPSGERDNNPDIYQNPGYTS